MIRQCGIINFQGLFKGKIYSLYQDRVSTAMIWPVANCITVWPIDCLSPQYLSPFVLSVADKWTFLLFERKKSRTCLIIFVHRRFLKKALFPLDQNLKVFHYIALQRKNR